MEAQANTTREQSHKNDIYDVGWRPSHGEDGGVGNKQNKKNLNSLQHGNDNIQLGIVRISIQKTLPTLC